MKMIWAIVRPEKVDEVAKRLDAGGFPAFTRFDVYGRGKQKGVSVKGHSYDMPKTTLMLVVEDEEAMKAAKIIEEGGRTGSMGDGRIFITSIEEAITIRTGGEGL